MRVETDLGFFKDTGACIAHGNYPCPACDAVCYQRDRERRELLRQNRIKEAGELLLPLREDITGAASVQLPAMVGYVTTLRAEPQVPVTLLRRCLNPYAGSDGWRAVVCFDARIRDRSFFASPGAVSLEDALALFCGRVLTPDEHVFLLIRNEAAHYVSLPQLGWFVSPVMEDY